MSAEPRALEIARPGVTLRGEEMAPEGDEASTVLLVHGVSATRRYVVHRSRTLPRAGFRLVGYDARGHGESDPAPAGEGYDYPALAADLAAVMEKAGQDPVVLAGHSMGAHTAVARALQDPSGIAGVVAIGPVVTGQPPTEEVLAYWETLAAGLEEGGVEGFLRAYAPTLNPDWRDTILRFTRERMEAHRHPQAVAQALREVPRSLPFESMEELQELELPVLVVASHDEADAAHPYAVAEAWAEALPQARLTSEEQGQSPLAWQGGRLSREIAAFCEEPAVRARLSSGR